MTTQIGEKSDRPRHRVCAPAAVSDRLARERRGARGVSYA